MGKNKAMEYDLIVVGSGSSASTVAMKCRKAGWKVAVVDRGPLGGTCPNKGCDPKKVLVAAAEAWDWARRMEGRGFEAANATIDWPELMATKRSFTGPIPEGTREKFANAGIDLYEATASFAGKNRIKAGDQILRGKYIHLATGAKPMPMPFEGAEHLKTSTDFMELNDLPARIVFVGGGYISFEFSHVAWRAGAQVTVLEMLSRPLGAFDSDLVDRLVEVSRGFGIDIRCEAPVVKIEKTGGVYQVHTEGGDNATYEADLVVHGGGRVPNIEELNVEKGNVNAGKRGIEVNEFLQSNSNPAVYASGDCADSGAPPLLPMASLEGSVAATNLLEGNKKKPDYRGIPSVVFTLPSLAMCGLSEAEAREQIEELDVRIEDGTSWYSTRRIGAEAAFCKVLIDRKNDCVVGAHLLGYETPETINLFAMAIRHRLCLDEIKGPYYGYPTHGNDINYML